MSSKLLETQTQQKVGTIWTILKLLKSYHQFLAIITTGHSYLMANFGDAQPVVTVCPAHRIILVVNIKLLTVTNYGGFGKLSLSFQNLLYCMAVDESQNRPHENSGHFFDSQKAVLMCQSGTEQSLK